MYNNQNTEIYTGYLDSCMFIDEYDVFVEYAMISLFNQIRGKAFVSFKQFEQLWQTAQTTSRSLKEQSDKIKLILISGIPGSGKNTLGIYLSKLLNIEEIESSTYVLPVDQSTKFSSEVFLNGLFKHCEQNQTSTVIGVIQSYHHLKKAIFEFKKNSTFNETFDLEHVITRVSAKNFYMHKNRNTYQFLLENCLKGICDAVIFEKGNVNQEEFMTMRKQLCEVNDDENILNVRGRTFEWKDLEQILSKKYTKYSLLYGKYFYGFEKEGKSSYYLESAATGGYYLYKIPLREDLVDRNIHKLFGNPIEDYKQLVPAEELKCEYESTVASSEADESDNKENLLSIVESGSERAARHKKKQEQAEQKRIQADLQQERMLIEEMGKVKLAMKQHPMIIERLKGLFLVEGKEEESDYRIISSFNEIKIRSCKNENKRLAPDELGFLIYGKNIDEEKFKSLMNAFRTQLRQKCALRTPESITEAEIKMLEEKYFGECMPNDFYHDGYSYVDSDGNRQYEHPNREKLIAVYVDKENEKIADYNRSVQKEWKADEAKYARCIPYLPKIL